MQELLRERRLHAGGHGVSTTEIFPEDVVRQILTDHPDAEYPRAPDHFALEDKAAEIALR